MNMLKPYIIVILMLLFSVVAKAQDKPNVLMIVLDDMNNYVGVMKGHPQAKTPNIDRLAGQGILFTNAHSNVPICSPSRASFMTGVSPVSSRNWGFDDWLKNETLINSKTLPEYVRENGYNAYATGKVFHNSKKDVWNEMGAIDDYGPLAYDGNKTTRHPSCPEAMAKNLGPLDATFASLSDVPDVPASDKAPGYKGWYNIKWNNKTPFRYVSDSDRDKMTDEKSVEWFQNKMKTLEYQTNTSPFFIAVGFIRPHTPLIVPQKYFDMFPLGKVIIPVLKKSNGKENKLELNSDKDTRGRVAFKALTSSYSSTEKALQKYVQAYLASVAFADDMVGQTLDALEKSRFKDNTVVMLFSDHGYNLGQKDYLFKYCLWEETTHIPLIIKAPKYYNNAGKTVDHPVSLIDVYPTIQELCSLKGSTLINDKGVGLDGFSLVSFLKNPKTNQWAGPDVALTIISSWKSKKPTEQHLSVRSKDYRYSHYTNGSEELYDHNNDPNEWNDLAEDTKFKKIKEELKSKMFDLVENQAKKTPLSAVLSKEKENEKKDEK
jgi:arylsulfatase A-like enzyme